MISPEKHAERRRKLADSMDGDYCIVVQASSTKPATADGSLPYAPSRNLYYLTGITQEGTTLVMWRLKGRDPMECLYISPYDEEFAKWFGTVLTREEATSISGITDIRFSGGESRFFDKLVSRERLQSFYFDWHNCGTDGAPGKRLIFVNRFRRAYPGLKVGSIADRIFQLRMTKDEDEIRVMKQAIELTRTGFEAAARKLAPGMNEAEFEAEMLYQWARAGEKVPAFPAIVAGGSRAT
ncbi:MAG TPA: aminopeptidase P N-terminal domain-containing protein, partial [Candidatus Sabulitectum sp.]|nr:aminopeptidase P N-terminal domain-containing protein [Candidatus Sabulitectum sp.]